MRSGRDERRGEHRVDRRHVREHRHGPRGAARAARARTNRAPRTPASNRAERLDAHVRGQDPASRARARARRARRRARRARAASDGGAERGVVGIDLLGDDDEPAHRARPRRRAHVRRTRAAKIEPSARTDGTRGRGEPLRERRSASTRTSASASACGSPGSTSRPLTPSSTRSGMPPTPAPTTGRPRRSASITTRPSPSERDGRTSSVARVERGRDSCGRQLAASTRSARQVGDEPLDDVRSACPCRRSAARAGQPRRREPPGRGEPVDVLVALEHADEERARLARAAAAAAAREGTEVRERREDRRRLDARPRARARACTPRRPHGVGARRTAARPTRVGDAAPSTRARARAVEPRRRPPVAVHLDDHRHAACRSERARPAASYGLWATIASGRNAARLARDRAGSAA